VKSLNLKIAVTANFSFQMRTPSAMNGVASFRRIGKRGSCLTGPQSVAE
jgi:hypothetical protein